MDYVLRADRLTKRYGRQKAVDNVSLHIAKGQIHGLIGRNGAGKTTLLKLICGLAAPTSGEIVLFGDKQGARGVPLARIGAFIEGPGLYQNMSAYDNLKLKCICLALR